MTKIQLNIVVYAASEYSMMVKHTPTNIHIALGSVCYLRFNEKNGAKVFLYRGAARCEDCKKPISSKRTFSYQTYKKRL